MAQVVAGNAAMTKPAATATLSERVIEIMFASLACESRSNDGEPHLIAS